MPRGVYPTVSDPKPRPGRVWKTCGKCPCCVETARRNTQRSREYRANRKRKDSVTEEELDRRFKEYGLGG